MLLATAPGSEGGPAAGLPWEDTTLLGRLVAQLAALGVGEFHVVTRPAWSGDLERSLASAGVAARMHRSEDRAGDLRAVAAIAGGSGEDALVVANADVLTQGEALAGLLADPRVATGVLVATRQLPRPTAFRIRGRRGVVLAAGTPYHVVGPTTGTFLGVLKIAARDRAAAADVAQRVAELLDGSLPAGWSDEFEAKVARWRLVLQRHGARGDAPEDGSDEEEQAPAGAVELAPEAEAELARRVGAAEQDVTALLLHGLVRSAVRVGTSHLRRLFWARPLSRDDVDLAASRIGEHSEEEALLESAVKANDGFFTTFFVSPYSKYIARWAARRGWSPNGVTALSMLVGALAAVAFGTGERAGLIAGAVLLQIAFTLDCVDGQLARYTRTFTAFGAWLDSIFDRTKEYAVFAGLAVGSARAGDEVWVLAAAALTLQTVRHMMDFSFNLAEDQATQPAVAGSLEEPPRPRRTAAPRRAPRVDEPGRAARAGVWIRKILGFPIGERFAAISITAALFDARATFVVLLVLGTYATVHRGVGRIRISLGRRGRGRAVLAPRSDPGQSHAALRDDGPLARMLGRLGGGRPAIPPIAIVTAGGLPLLAAAAIGGDDVAWGIAAAVVGWAILLGGLSSGRPLGDRMRWAVPPSVRLIEYGGVLWLAALAGASALPAAFALLCAITFRHYDAFYRSRQRGDPPPPWVADAAGGWDGRLLVVLALAAAGAGSAGLYAAAALLGAMLVGENVASWIAHRRSPARRRRRMTTTRAETAAVRGRWIRHRAARLHRGRGARLRHRVVARAPARAPRDRGAGRAAASAAPLRPLLRDRDDRRRRGRVPQALPPAWRQDHGRMDRALHAGPLDASAAAPRRARRQAARAARGPIERYRVVLADRLARYSEAERFSMADAVDRRSHGAQLARLHRFYDPARILVLQLERCHRDPLDQYRRTLEFLGVRDTAFVPRGLRRKAAGRPESITVAALLRLGLPAGTRRRWRGSSAAPDRTARRRRSGPTSRPRCTRRWIPMSPRCTRSRPTSTWSSGPNFAHLAHRRALGWCRCRGSSCRTVGTSPARTASTPRPGARRGRCSPAAGSSRRRAACGRTSSCSERSPRSPNGARPCASTGCSPTACDCSTSTSTTAITAGATRSRRASSRI